MFSVSVKPFLFLSLTALTLSSRILQIFLCQTNTSNSRYHKVTRDSRILLKYGYRFLDLKQSSNKEQQQHLTPHPPNSPKQCHIQQYRKLKYFFNKLTAMLPTDIMTKSETFQLQYEVFPIIPFLKMSTSIQVP